MGLSLAELIDGLTEALGDEILFADHRGCRLEERAVGIQDDSRKVQKGEVFVAIKGTQFDSHTVLDQVVIQHPAVLIVEDKGAVPGSFTGAVIQVRNSRRALALLASLFFGKPSERMLVIGVTGTNGKTTLTYLLEHLLLKKGLRPAVIGTVNRRFEDDVLENNLTTPSTVKIQQDLARWVKAGANALVIEVTSIAVDQGRVEGIDFDIGLFTNLTRDHLDYHGDMESYYQAKKGFFTLLEHSSKARKMAVVNPGGEYGERLFEEIGVEKYRVGEGLKTTGLSVASTGLEFFVNETQHVELPMVGEYNYDNALLAMTALYQWWKDEKLFDFSDFKGVPGRLQLVPLSEGKLAFVDYAHTPDALENSARVLHDLLQQGQELWTVFGCGGDRDRGKRPQMANMAEKYSDHVVVTSDNPRFEQPEKIIEDIMTGFTSEFQQAITVEPDRVKAIEKAVREMPEGALLLVAGKGHEDYQDIKGVKHPLDDYKELIRYV